MNNRLYRYQVLSKSPQKNKLSFWRISITKISDWIKTLTTSPKKSSKQIGWFVGWIEKSNRKIYIVNLIKKNFSGSYDAGLESYNQVRDYIIGI